MRRLLAIAALAFVVSVACAPPRDPANLITPTVRAGCILLRAFTSDGRVSEVCATAEDLAPLIGEILAAHEANASSAEPATPLLAFTIAPPKRPAPRRRCVTWITLQPPDDGGIDGGSGDASSIR